MVTEAEVRPIPVQIAEHQVFVNGDMSLTDTGNRMQSLAQDYIFLEKARRGELVDDDGQPVVVTEGRQKVMEQSIAGTFAEVSSAIGIPQDESMVGEVVFQYLGVVKRRREEVHRGFREENHRILTPGQETKITE